MPITLIEGYVVVCDRCGREEVFWESKEHHSAIEIERAFADWLAQNGWVISDDGKVYCNRCSGKIAAESRPAQMKNSSSKLNVMAGISHPR